jgi:hypothetical protein
MNDLLAVVYLIGFAAIGGGAFALMTQSLRRPRGWGPISSTQQPRMLHPEAPEPGQEVLYVDFSRERLELLYQQNP